MKVFLVTLFFLSGLYANSSWYIGMGGLSGSSDTRYIPITDYQGQHGETEVHDAMMVNAKVGYVFSTNTRFEISLAAIELDGHMFRDTNRSGTSSLSGMDFDWIYVPDNTNFGEFVTFISLGLGFYTYEDTEGLFDAVDVSDSGDLGGAALNVGLGILFYTSETFEIELSYKYKSIGWNLIKATDGTILNSETKVKGGYIGFRWLI